MSDELENEWNDDYLRDLASVIMSSQPIETEVLHEVLYGLLVHLDDQLAAAKEGK